MSKRTLSVIIPVYNSEKYLEDCVAGIRRQTYTDLQIILVDDGSTDGSPAICDRLAQEDGRIVAIHKPNGGTSSARNRGIDAACGEYVTFMDNDDSWESENAIEEIMKQLDEGDTDVLFHENMVYWQDTKQTIVPNIRCKRASVFGKSKEEALSALIGSGIFSLYCVWSKVIKTSLLKEHDIRFPEQMRNEDTCFCGKLLRVARTYDFYEKSFYLYRKGHASAQTVQSIKYSHLKDLQTILTEFADSIAAETVPEGEKKALLSFMAFPYSVWMGQSTMVEDSRVKEDLPVMKKYRYLLKYDLHPAVKKVRLFHALCRYRMTCKFLGVYIKKNNHM